MSVRYVYEHAVITKRHTFYDMGRPPEKFPLLGSRFIEVTSYLSFDTKCTSGLRTSRSSQGGDVHNRTGDRVRPSKAAFWRHVLAPPFRLTLESRPR